MLSLVEADVLVECEEENDKRFCNQSGIPKVFSLRQLHIAVQVLLELIDYALN